MNTNQGIAMTYDPNNQDRRIRDRAGMDGATMAGIALAVLLGLGILVYAMTRDDRTASTTTSSPTTTTGQSQKAPSPVPPAK